MNLQNYENFLSSSFSQESLIIRQLLGDPQSAIGTVTQKLIAKYSHHVSSLLTTYRLLDLELLHNGPGHPIPLLPSYPNRITPQMVEAHKVKDRWRKLENWRELLIEFQDCYHHNNFSIGSENTVSVKETPMRGSLAHLHGLAGLHTNLQFGNIVQNFRGAALHWTYLEETTKLNTIQLPNIPDTVSAIADKDTFHHLNEMFPPNVREKMDAYLRQHSQGELVLPLHLSLLLTPCFLLMPMSLVKSKFPRQSIYQVSIS